MFAERMFHFLGRRSRLLPALLLPCRQRTQSSDPRSLLAVRAGPLGP